MRKYSVICQQDRTWVVEVEASTREEAIEKVDGLILTKGLPIEEAQEGAIETCCADAINVEDEQEEEDPEIPEGSKFTNVQRCTEGCECITKDCVCGCSEDCDNGSGDKFNIAVDVTEDGVPYEVFHEYDHSKCHVVIPETTTSIEDELFKGRTDLKGVSIEDEDCDNGSIDNIFRTQYNDQFKYFDCPEDN